MEKFVLGYFVNNAVLENGINVYLNREKIYKPELNQYLNNLSIIDMSYVANHTLLLTSNGDICGWGLNDRGLISNEIDSEFQLIPFKMNYLMSEKFKSISYGFQHSVALTEDGRVLIELNCPELRSLCPLSRVDLILDAFCP